MTRLVLASASPGRRKVLRQAGIDPLVIVSRVDEDTLTSALGDDTSPDQVVAALAEAKADDVTSRLAGDVATDCVVIGCDSMLLLNGSLRGKPGSPEASRRQWNSMAGRSGELLTGHCLLRIVGGSVTRREVQTRGTTVHFASPTDDELEAYIRSREPLGVAGGFTIDGYGGWFIDSIQGDPSNVIGLSLPLVRSLFTAARLTIDELRAANPPQTTL